MTYRFTISTDPTTASDVVECNGLRATSAKSCAARKLARALIAAGAEDGPVQAFGQDDKLRYTVQSLWAFAAKTLTEDHLRLAWHAQHPNADVSGADFTAFLDWAALRRLKSRARRGTALPTTEKRVLA
jgi:hypothetical protein